MSRKIDLKGRWAVVTGASSGIGLCFARTLAEMGCNIFGVSNQAAELEGCAVTLRKEFGVEATALYLDLTEEDACDTLMQALEARNIVPYILINNAGIFDFRAVEHLSPRRINLYIDLHVRAVTQLCRSVGMLMASARGEGFILNMSSMSCWMPMPGIAMYSATKAYLRAFSRAFRIEMKSRGVSVTVACPGGIATDLFGLPKNLQRLGIKVGALATPEDFVRKALRRMLRHKVQYINGFINRVAIVAVASMPESARMMIKTRLLDRLDK